MSLSLRHIISALRFSRLTVFFLVLETVLACAFLCNAFAFIARQAAPMLAPTGIAPGQVLFVDHINLPFGFDDKTGKPSGGANPADLHAMEQRIHAIAGVTAVSVGVGVPFSTLFSYPADLHRPHDKAVVAASGYYGDHPVDALGLHLVKGRRFSADEIGQVSMGKSKDLTVAIITQALAKRLFPAGDAIGKRVLLQKKPDGTGVVIVGIVAHLSTRQPVADKSTDAAVLLPAIPVGFPLVGITVRTRPGVRAAVARKLPTIVKSALHLPVTMEPRVRTFEAMRGAYFGPNRSLIWLMLGVTLAVVAITVIGIMGLTGFWVQRRTRQIGIRRALGATRGDILRYFLVENLLVVGTGVVLGVVAAYAGNLWLMGHLEIPRLPWQWLPIGAVALCVLGQLSVLPPARRAAAVPPVVATRSV